MQFGCQVLKNHTHRFIITEIWALVTIQGGHCKCPPSRLPLFLNGPIKWPFLGGFLSMILVPFSLKHPSIVRGTLFYKDPRCKLSELSLCCLPLLKSSFILQAACGKQIITGTNTLCGSVLPRIIACPNFSFRRKMCHQQWALVCSHLFGWSINTNSQCIFFIGTRYHGPCSAPKHVLVKKNKCPVIT